MLRPEVRYAHADDGAAIAYSVVGEGPITIVLVSPLVSHVEVIWAEPALEHLISRLGVCSRVVLFDRRGIGLSDGSPGPEEGAGLSRLAADVAAVLDGCDMRAAVLMGVTFGAQLALQFAADFPSRTQALVLVGGWAKLTRITQFDFETDPGQIDAWADAAARSSPVGAGLVGSRKPTQMADRGRPPAWSAFRVARPARDLRRSAIFYGDLLGLASRGGFDDHDGYDGIFFSLPGDGELELTSGPAQRRPGTEEDLLVLYTGTLDEVISTAERLAAAGVPIVHSANPYWNRWGRTVLDPDGHRVVIAARER